MFSQFHKGKITLGASQVGANAGDVSWISGSERFPGGGLATHTLSCRIPWTEELGGLESIGSQRVGHD